MRKEGRNHFRCVVIGAVRMQEAADVLEVIAGGDQAFFHVSAGAYLGMSNIRQQ